MTTRTARASYSKAGLYTASLAALWVILAAINPATTYHLAPILVAGALPAMIALDGEDQISAQLLASAAAVGLIAALATTILIDRVGWSEGPSLLPFGGTVTEGALFAVGGAVLGFALAVRLQKR